MVSSESGRTGGWFGILFAVLLGFFLGEVAVLIARAPGLLRPNHLGGLGALLVSAATLYVAAGVYLVLFYVMVRVISSVFRLRLTSWAAALVTVVAAFPFIILQHGLQERMLGKWMAPSSPRFYVPTAISLAILVAILILIGLATKGAREAPRWLKRLTGGRSLTAIAFVVFIAYALLSKVPINVLGLFPEEVERMSRMEYRTGVAGEAAPDSPNFIVLKIEAFRWDEFTAQNAPFLWRLAEQNVWFKDYYVVASATRASVTSFFTSLYPVQHGSYDQPLVGRNREEMVIRSVAVAESIQTVPKLLREHGYHTIEITSNDATMDRMFGFEEVFNRFDSIEPYRFRVPSLDPFESYGFLKKYTPYWRVLKIIVTSPEHSWTYFDAPRVNATVKRELENRLARGDERPFFLYVHYMEPHSPYYRHPYQAVHLNLYAPDRRESILEGYRSEIKAVDRSIADLYAFLDQSGMLDNTYLFISADHGEEFYDHGKWGHGKSVYPEVVKVPALLVAPAGKRSMRWVTETVENIDILPTFADLAGIPPWRFWQGRSLVPFITDDPETEPDTTEDTEETAFSQFNDARLYFWAGAVKHDWQVIFREPGRQKADAYAPRKEDRRIMLFNLAADPLAKNDLHGQGLEVEEELVKALEDHLGFLEATAHLFRGKETEVDKDRLEQLKALGYIQ
jgi:arylsulfatase